MRSLRSTIEARSDDDLNPLETGTVPAEVRPVVDAMNTHLAQQRRGAEVQREFLADASHQLRTPLAILTTQAGYALREQDVDAIKASVRSMQLQLQRSRRVAEQLLSLAQASSQTEFSANEAVCDANHVARQVVLAALPLALEKQQDLGWRDARGADVAEDEDDGQLSVLDLQAMTAPIRARSTDLHELLANLVHNAIVYTPAGGTITVAVQVWQSWVEIRVADSGPGIAAADRERAFQRFVRLGARAEGVTNGSGLGLSIARAYAQRLGGSVVLSDADGGPGLVVVVRIPLAISA